MGGTLATTNRRRSTRRSITVTEVTYFRCKEGRHDWETVEVADGQGEYRLRKPLRRGSFPWRRISRCPECGTVRHELLDWQGAVLSRQYRYPEDYRDPNGRKSKAELRVLFRKAWLVEPSPKE
jgi:hypothetical protein